jgi:hypothetical protein
MAVPISRGSSFLHTEQSLELQYGHTDDSENTVLNK